MPLILHQKTFLDLLRVQRLQFLKRNLDNLGLFIGVLHLILKNIFILLVEDRKMHIGTTVSRH